jgi:hypothetical protein
LFVLECKKQAGVIGVSDEPGAEMLSLRVNQHQKSEHVVTEKVKTIFLCFSFNIYVEGVLSDFYRKAKRPWDCGAQA